MYQSGCSWPLVLFEMYLDEDLALGRAGDVRLLDGNLVVFLGDQSLHFRHFHLNGEYE